VTTAPVVLRRRRLPSGGFGRFVLRRLVALVLLSLGITFVAFVLTELVPSNAVATNLGEQAAGDPVAVAASSTTTGSTGRSRSATRSISTTSCTGISVSPSLTHGPVTHDLGQFIPATGELAL